ncbi:MAG: sensor histidine kinase [Suipraeoptans sp.]
MKDEKVRVGKIQLYLLYLWKRVRDSKIKTKLTLYLISIILLCSITIGSVSYVNTRDTLIENTEESAISALKQVGTKLDDRIREFQNSSYTFSQREAVQRIYALNELENNPLEHNLNQFELNSNLTLLNSVHNYSDYVIMQNTIGQIYIHNKDEIGNKIDNAKAKEIIENLGAKEDEKAIIQWIKEDNQVFFVRKIMKAGSDTVIGKMIISVSDDLFLCGEDNNKFVENSNLVISSIDGEIYKNNSTKLSKKKLNEYKQYNNTKYYYYTTIDEVNGEKYMVIPLKTVKYQWHVLCFIPYNHIVEKANQIILQVIITAIILLVLGLIVAFLIYRVMLRNLNIIESGMQEYEKGNYTQVLAPSGYDEFGMLILQFNHMGLKINELNQITIKEQEEKQNMQYMIMEAQINPHFLYNTLGSLKWLAYENGQNDLVKLSDSIINLLRFTIKNANKIITLKEEVEYIKNYIYIQKARYENAFEDLFEITDEAYKFEILGFIIQPFVENCILHGVDISKTSGKIWIKGSVDNEMLHLVIEDNGVGMSDDKVQEIDTKINNGRIVNYSGFNGIGVINIILRMKFMYGDNFKYKVESIIGKGTKVTLIIPRMENMVEKENTDS